MRSISIFRECSLMPHWKMIPAIKTATCECRHITRGKTNNELVLFHQIEKSKALYLFNRVEEELLFHVKKKQFVVGQICTFTSDIPKNVKIQQ